MTGILTFHRGPNYGGFLQAWHLKHAIETLGEEAEVVNFQNHHHLTSETPRLSIRRPGTFKSAWRLMKKMRPFHAGIASLTSGRLITDSAKVPWECYEQIVVGSDVVWDFAEPRFGAEQAYFGMAAGQEKIRMLAYAASCGSTPANTKAPSYVQTGLQRFESILVRDANTAEMVKQHTGCNPPQVVDPTWLGDDPQASCPVDASRPYLLIYGTGVDKATSDLVAKFAKHQGFALVGVFCPPQSVDRMLWNVTPFEWVSLIRNAQAVVTTSFHGTIYAAKYETPVVFVRSQKTALKTGSILQKIGLNRHSLAQGEAVTTEQLEPLLQHPATVPEMARLRRESLDALSRALKK